MAVPEELAGDMQLLFVQLNRNTIVSTDLTVTFLNERRSLIWTVTRIVKDVQTAEDLAHEAYLRTRKACDAGVIDHVEAFLYKTARNLALDHLRRKTVREQLEASGFVDGLADHIPANTLSPEEICLERDQFRQFYETLSGLPERAQAVVILARIEQWPHAKIAETLNISERTVFNDLKRALAQCRESLEKS